MSSVKDAGKYRKALGAVVAVAILAAIFVPFQNVDAFTVELEFPDHEGSVAPSLLGQNFTITIDVEAGELISIESIEIVLDNDLSSVERAVFNSTGHRTSGSELLVVDNAVEISTFTTSSGYGYGYGLVSDGTTFSSPYSYSFTSNSGFIGGNTLGYSNAGVTNQVSGLIGPGTITITGSLVTPGMEDGDHTLDVLIDTGAGGNDEDQLTAPTFEFEVEGAGDSGSGSAEVADGAETVTVATHGLFGDDPVVELTFDPPVVQGGQVIVTSDSAANFADHLSNSGLLEGYGLELDGNNVIFNTDSGQQFIAAGLIWGIDVSGLVLDGDTEVTLEMDYDDSGLDADDEERVRIMHLPA